VTKMPAYMGWLRETKRLYPEIMRDAVAYALFNRAQAVFEEMRAEKQALIEKLNEALARIDADAGYQVFIVPGQRYLQEAMEAMRKDPSLHDGDRIRCSDTHAEYIRVNGMWQRSE
jgi:hypothetical protein